MLWYNVVMSLPNIKSHFTKIASANTCSEMCLSTCEISPRLYWSGKECIFISLSASKERLGLGYIPRLPWASILLKIKIQKLCLQTTSHFLSPHLHWNVTSVQMPRKDVSDTHLVFLFSLSSLVVSWKLYVQLLFYFRNICACPGSWHRSPARVQSSPYHHQQWQGPRRWRKVAASGHRGLSGNTPEVSH